MYIFNVMRIHLQMFYQCICGKYNILILNVHHIDILSVAINLQFHVIIMSTASGHVVLCDLL